MVRIGFIVEGHSEDILLKSASFQSYLATLGLQSSKELVTNAIGRNNLYRVNNDLANIEERMNDWIRKLHDKGATQIFIVLNKENNTESFAEFKSKVYHLPQNVIVIAVQTIEAWFLADTATMRKYLHPDFPGVEFPESIPNPFDEIDKFRTKYKGRGVGTKVRFANTIIHSCGFSLATAAAHPACPSAAYFQLKLTEAAQPTIPS